MHDARASFKQLKLHPATFPTQFPVLVTSTLGLNVLAMFYIPLKQRSKMTTLPLYKYAAPTFGINPAVDAKCESSSLDLLWDMTLPDSSHFN